MLRRRLSLTADQEKQVDALQKEVDAKLDKILNAEQKQQLKQMRERGPGGFGPGGPPPGGFGPGGPPPGGFGPGGPPPDGDGPPDGGGPPPGGGRRPARKRSAAARSELICPEFHLVIDLRLGAGHQATAVKIFPAAAPLGGIAPSPDSPGVCSLRRSSRQWSPDPAVSGTWSKVGRPCHGAPRLRKRRETLPGLVLIPGPFLRASPSAPGYCSGTRRWTLVPRPGLASMVIRPPSSAARSCIPRRPRLPP